MSTLQKIYIALLALVMSFGLAASVMAPAAAQGARDDVCAGINLGGGTCNNDGAGLTKVVRLVIQIISAVAGIAAVIMIVVGGLRYITSGGDASKVAGAKSAIIYALIGLVIVVLSQAIVRFVLTNAI